MNNVLRMNLRFCTTATKTFFHWIFFRQI